jgi:hypothetical protein
VIETIARATTVIHKVDEFTGIEIRRTEMFAEIFGERKFAKNPRYTY